MGDALSQFSVPLLLSPVDSGAGLTCRIRNVARSGACTPQRHKELSWHWNRQDCKTGWGSLMPHDGKTMSRFPYAYYVRCGIIRVSALCVISWARVA